MNLDSNENRERLETICNYLEVEGILCPECTKSIRNNIYKLKDCNASFKVTHGTVFHRTQIPLQKWFLAIALILNAKKSISSYQLERDLDLNQRTAWFLLTRVRAEMANKNNSILLQGIIEADETFIGGKPRKKNKKGR